MTRRGEALAEVFHQDPAVHAEDVSTGRRSLCYAHEGCARHRPPSLTAMVSAPQTPTNT